MFKNISKGFWFQVLPAFILSAITVVLLIAGIIPLYYLIPTFFMWILVSGLGIAVGYHRIFSHRTHLLPAWKENIILFFANFGGQGPSIFWVALHRGYHHPHADTEKDLHSPVTHSMLEAFIGWQIKVTESNSLVNIKYAVDLIRKPNHIWFFKNYLYVLWIIPLLVAIFDWKLSLTMFWLVTGISILQDNSVNVFGHLKGIGGYRNFNTNDNSHNHLILSFFTWGQFLHNNHHHSPKSYNFGSSISNKWWEWDPCDIFKPFLK